MTRETLRGQTLRRRSPGKLLRDLSVRKKLLTISMIASAGALVVAGAVLVVYDLINARDTTRQELTVLAKVIGERSTAALTFGDRRQAGENLAALKARHSILSACLFDADHQLFASYLRNPGVAACPEALPVSSASRGALFTISPVELDGEEIGTIFLRSELEEILVRGARYAGVVVLVALLAAAAAFVLSSRLQRIVSSPLEHLAATAGAITRGRDYSLRAVKEGEDELGALVEAFNQMLETVENRDREILQANRDLEDLVMELEAKNAELERFTYTVSHDLKTPLITIKGYLGLLERDTKAGAHENMRKDLAHIHGAADQMGLLLSELLELSRIGRLINDPEAVPMGELIAEALELVAGPLVERGVEVRVAPDLAVVRGDRPRLLEVVQNLLENAVKFMGDQPAPCVEIGWRNGIPVSAKTGKNGAGRLDVYFVRDNGIGIEEHYQDKVFGLFERLDPRIDGTGIGLAIVKRIIEFHGGQIWIESQGRGHGTAFCFTLPRDEENQHE